MAYKLWLLVVILALVIVTETSSSFDDVSWGIGRSLASYGDGDLPAAVRTCSLGTCVGGDEDDVMDNNDERRQLRSRGRYISYDVLRRDSIPCNRRGSSYYNCRNNARANPYRRSCTYITHCARNLG